MNFQVRQITNGYILEYVKFEGNSKTCEIYTDVKDLHKKIKTLLGIS